MDDVKSSIDKISKDVDSLQKDDIDVSGLNNKVITLQGKLDESNKQLTGIQATIKNITETSTASGDKVKEGLKKSSEAAGSLQVIVYALIAVIAILSIIIIGLVVLIFMMFARVGSLATAVK